MGGSLSNKRLSSAEFKSYIAKLSPKLERALGSVKHQVVPYYELKQDFGDVDYVVLADAGDVLPSIKHVFAPDGLFVNDGIISFTFDDFQVDLICTKTNYDTSLAYFAYNDIGNLLGRIYHKLGLKFGQDGLLYPLRDARGGVREEVVVSKDMSSMLAFIGCDYAKWSAGFRTMEEMFRFVVASQYFDRSVYEGELSAINKKRDKKRKTFSYFLTWLEIAQPSSRYAFTSRHDREQYVPGIDAYFGTVIQQKQKDLAAVLEREDRFRNKFSGDLLMMLVPLKGQDLGKFLNQYKRYMIQEPAGEMTRELNTKFEDVILGMDQDEINNSIVKFYDGN